MQKQTPIRKFLSHACRTIVSSGSFTSYSFLSNLQPVTNFYLLCNSFLYSYSLLGIHTYVHTIGISVCCYYYVEYHPLTYCILYYSVVMALCSHKYRKLVSCAHVKPLKVLYSHAPLIQHPFWQNFCLRLKTCLWFKVITYKK